MTAVAATAATTTAAYPSFAERLLETGLISDPWIDGQPRFDEAPCIVTPSQAQALGAAAGRVTMAFDELVRVVAANPDVLDDFFGLTDVQKLMFAVSAPLWHAYARADVFRCADDRLQICELNCDTPSGFAETIALARTADGARGRDPSAALASSWLELVRRAHAALPSAREGVPRVGIIYPTELTEDLGQIAWWRDLFQSAGWPVTLGAPFNLDLTPGGHVTLMGRPCDVIVRHYKTDWWGERRPVWTDEAEYPDPDALVRPLAMLLAAQENGRCAVLNPFGAVVPQNKRAMAFLWERLSTFSAKTQSTVRAYIPFSQRLETMDAQRLRRERGDWVLKSDYGCEGDEVLVGAETTAALWEESLRMAVPGRWIAQRRFAPLTDAQGRLANHGVYIIAGQPAGIYTRLSAGATDPGALSVPTLVAEGA